MEGHAAGPQLPSPESQLPSDLLERLVELRRRGEPVALATVVAIRAPASARPGDRALVLATGELVGWVGGSCAQPTIRREALRALADGRPRLVRLSPEAGPSPAPAGVVEDAMTCHSGGSLEIYVEPFRPPPELLVTGDSPVAEALARLGALAGYRVGRELPAGDDPSGRDGRPELGAAEGVVDSEQLGRPPERYVVVAGMSGEDEEELARALALQPAYLALVGSRKRLAELTGRLRERGMPPEQLARIKGPAGLDIGATTAIEIAISIIAEITLRRRSGQPERPGPVLEVPASAVAPASDEAIDPVCGMRVAIPGARHVLEHAGQTFYFCCPACRGTFAGRPGRYPSRPARAEAP